jgi:hypothetical protein
MASFLESVKGEERACPIICVFKANRLVEQTLTRNAYLITHPDPARWQLRAQQSS